MKKTHAGRIEDVLPEEGQHAQPVQLWHRRTDESRPAYDAFFIYLTLEADRSVARVAQKCRKHPSLIRRWAHDHRWVRRAWLYDCAQDRAREKTHTQEMLEMSARHAASAKFLNAACLRALQEINPKDLKPAEVALLLRVSVDIERKARGAQGSRRYRGRRRRMPDEDALLPDAETPLEDGLASLEI